MRQARRSRGARRPGGRHRYAGSPFPTVGEIKIQRLLQAPRPRTASSSRSILYQAAAPLSSRPVSAPRAHTSISIIEVNTGQDRAGAHSRPQEAVELAVAIASDYRGCGSPVFMTHEGHAGFSAPDEIATIAEECRVRALVDTAERIRGPGHLPHSTSASAPPRPRGLRRGSPGVTEMRQGHLRLSTTTTRSGMAASARIAARREVVSTVVSRPAPDRAIVDAGSKALALDPSPSHPGSRLHRRPPGCNDRPPQRRAWRGRAPG